MVINIWMHPSLTAPRKLNNSVDLLRSHWTTLLASYQDTIAHLCSTTITRKWSKDAGCRTGRNIICIRNIGSRYSATILWLVPKEYSTMHRAGYSRCCCQTSGSKICRLDYQGSNYRIMRMCGLLGWRWFVRCQHGWLPCSEWVSSSLGDRRMDILM